MGEFVVVAIISMGMIVDTAKTEVDYMRQYNKRNCGNQQPGFILNKELFQYQQYHTQAKQDHRSRAMMMFAVAVV